MLTPPENFQTHPKNLGPSRRNTNNPPKNFNLPNMHFSIPPPPRKYVNNYPSPHPFFLFLPLFLHYSKKYKNSGGGVKPHEIRPCVLSINKNVFLKILNSPLDWRQCGNSLALFYFAVVMELPDSLWMHCKSEFGVIFLRCSPR